MVALARMKRALTPHQATNLIGRKVGDQPPNVAGATLAEDMTTRDPLLAALPPADPGRAELLRDQCEQLLDAPTLWHPGPLTGFTSVIRDTVTDAIADAPDASPQWSALAHADWTPSSSTPCGPGADYRIHAHETAASWIMLVPFHNNMRGGNLAAPEAGAVLSTDDAWLLFIPADMVHGLTTQRPTCDTGYQFTAVFTANPVMTPGGAGDLAGEVVF